MNDHKVVISNAQPKELLVNSWSKKINAHLDKSAESFLAAGRELVAAKERLNHGEFQKLFLPGNLKVDQRTAQILMRVARNKMLSNAKNFTHLPPALASLNALAGLETKDLQNAIDTKVVTPSMTTSDVKVLVKRFAKTKTENAAIIQPITAANDSVAVWYDLNASLQKIRRLVDFEREKCPEKLINEFFRGLASITETAHSKY